MISHSRILTWFSAPPDKILPAKIHNICVASKVPQIWRGSDVSFMHCERGWDWYPWFSQTSGAVVSV